MNDFQRAKDYLDRISPDCEREVWVKVLMGLKNTLGDEGEFLARGWSADSDKFDPQAFKHTWRSLRYDGNITLGSLALYAGHVPAVRQPRRSTQDYARKLWEESASGDVQSHPYAISKLIDHDFGAQRGTASGKIVGRDADCIIVPMRDWEGRVAGVECVNPNGLKQTFGRKGYLILGFPEAASHVHIAEGWGTMWGLAQMFPEQFAGIVVFGKHALDRAAEEASKRYAGRVIIHCEQGKRDCWDVWSEGQREAYRAGILGGCNG